MSSGNWQNFCKQLVYLDSEDNVVCVYTKHLPDSIDEVLVLVEEDYYFGTTVMVHSYATKIRGHWVLLEDDCYDLAPSSQRADDYTYCTGLEATCPIDFTKAVVMDMQHKYDMFHARVAAAMTKD